MKRLVSSYLENKKLSDIELVPSNGNPIPAHSFILCARSSVFEAMLSKEFRENTTKQISFPEYSELAIKHFLNHIYSYRNTMTGETVIELLHLSKQYYFPSLTEACKTFIKKNINDDNIWAIYIALLNLDEEKDLQQNCLDYILSNADALFLSPHISSLSVEILINILKSETMNSSELSIFKGCLNWAKAQPQKSENPSTIASVMSPLLPYIRFGCMTPEEIATIVAPSNVLSQSDLLELLILVASHGASGTTKFSSKPRLMQVISPSLPFFKPNNCYLSKNELIDSMVSLNSGDHYYNVLIITSTGILTCNKWDGTSGGKLFIKTKKLKIEKGGVIDLTGVGYRGGKCTQKGAYPDESYQGESYNGEGKLSLSNNQGGGGGGNTSGQYGSIGGGGGGYGTPGNYATPNTFNLGNRLGGQGGFIYGKEDLSELYMGSGGGGGTLYYYYTGYPHGGAGGGVLVIETDVFECYGTIMANGANGVDGSAQFSSGGGGGSGGSILIYCHGSFINNGKIIAEGGIGGVRNVGGHVGIATDGGSGGNGRIRITGVTTDFGLISPSPFTKNSPLTFTVI